MIVAQHRDSGRLIITVCDDALVGKRFEQGNRQLDVSGSFFQGKRMDEQECISLLTHASVAYFVGKQSVAFGIAQDIIDKKQVRRVQNIPHAQALLE
ncbi:DUF424 family protein [Candidatus Woesearchaeota archaeon]|nr:DUF424 family protein [Candidatus Woesearchaeota archaeon]